MLDLLENSRGFLQAEFMDRYGKACSIQQSSLATEECIWLGVNGEQTRMHLTRQMVAGLLPHLQHFAEAGSIAPTATPEQPQQGGEIADERRAAAWCGASKVVEKLTTTLPDGIAGGLQIEAKIAVQNVLLDEGLFDKPQTPAAPQVSDGGPANAVSLRDWFAMRIFEALLNNRLTVWDEELAESVFGMADKFMARRGAATS